MFYIKGRVRKCKLFQLTHTLLIDNSFHQYQYLHFRFNSTTNTETCANIKRPYDSNNTDQSFVNQLDVKYKADNLISFMINNYKSSESINSLFEFDYSIFKNYEDQWIMDETKKDEIRFRFSQIRPRLETIEYTTIPEINQYLKEFEIMKLISLITDRYNRDIYLTPNEFEKLVFDCYPYRSLIYKIVKLYAKKYDLSWFNDAVLREMLFISYLNLDFKLFDELFNKYILLIKELSPVILNVALEVYLRTENVTVASHFFAQYVITSEKLPTYILENYVRTFFDVTWNAKPCLEAYKLWLSRGFNTNESTDAYMLTIIRGNGSEEELKWMVRSLGRRNRLDFLSIKWNNSLCLLANSFSVYKQLMEPKNFKNFEQKIKNDQSSVVKKLLRDLHLKYQNFTPFIESLPSTVNSSREFGEITLKITRHLQLEERPDLIINFFKLLRRQTNFKFHFQHLILLWQSLIKEYPHLAKEIHTSFRIQLKASKNQKYAFLLKVCTIRQSATTSRTIKRWYPRLFLVQVRSEFTVPDRPKLGNIQLRLRNGIIPTNEILNKTLKMISIGDDYDRLLGIVNEKTIHTGSEDLNLDIEIFWKERRAGNWWSARRFVKDSFDKIEAGRYTVKMRDLVKLFRLCVKFNLHQEAEQTLDCMSGLNLRFKTEDLLIFVSMLVKWYWVRKEYKEIVYIFEWFKNDKFPLLINEFFIENLVNIGEKNKRISIEEIEREKDEDDEIKEHKLDVIRQLMDYHNASVAQLKKKMEDDKRKLLKDIDKDWQRIFSWIDHDTNEKVKLMKTS